MCHNTKKAAMFGLEGESLKKQSGELFLARLQRLTFRLVEGHQAIMPLNSKGAMFGLDARIALAIFAALSVISGAALYNVIQHTKAVRLLTEIREIGKAWEQFYLDTGIQFVPYDLDTSSTWYHVFKQQELLVGSRTGWKGPYLPADWMGSCHYYTSCSANVMRYNNADRSGPSWGDSTCQSGNDCGIWARIHVSYAGIDPTIVNRIDEIVDGGDGQLKGDFRWNDGYELRIAPATNPYD